MKKLIFLVLTFSYMNNASETIHRRTYISCSNPGTHQDVAKTPIITNTSNQNIGQSTKIFWQSSDNDSGFIYGPLAKGASKSGLGQPGNAYSCQAYY